MSHSELLIFCPPLCMLTISIDTIASHSMKDAPSLGFILPLLFMLLLPLPHWKHTLSVPMAKTLVIFHLDYNYLSFLVFHCHTLTLCFYPALCCLHNYPLSIVFLKSLHWFPFYHKPFILTFPPDHFLFSYHLMQPLLSQLHTSQLPTKHSGDSATLTVISGTAYRNPEWYDFSHVFQIPLQNTLLLWQSSLSLINLSLNPCHWNDLFIPSVYFLFLVNLFPDCTTTDDS